MQITITESMQKTIDETNRRREKQAEYNADHGIVPTQIHRSKRAFSLRQRLLIQNMLKQTHMLNRSSKRAQLIL
jgi:excinuclease ABC subunit B